MRGLWLGLALTLLAGGAQSATFTVRMVNFTFEPRQLTVNVGDTVIWLNQDFAQHDSVSGTNGLPSGLWRGPLLAQGGSFSFTFNVPPGAYGYYCTPHFRLGMTGIVTVAVPAEVPVITLQPQSQTVVTGKSATFVVTAVGTTPLSYQWLFNGAAVAGGTSSTLTLENVQTNHAGAYSVIVSNSAGTTTSLSAILTVTEPANTPPIVAITNPAQGERFPVGAEVTVQAEASAPEGVIAHVQFFRNTQPIGSATNPPYAITLAGLTPGANDFVAIAQDDAGRRSTSAPVRILIFRPETTRPVVRINRSPPNFSRLTSPAISLAGIASDDTGLDRIEFQINGGSFTPATGTTVWTADLTLAPGNNIVLVRGVDLAGNTSLPLARYYTLIAQTKLEVLIVGQGRITPDLTGRLLQVGKTYSLKAVPAPGRLFVGWADGGGQISSLNPRYSYTMSPGLKLVASFTPNPFFDLAGPYRGMLLSAAPGDATPVGTFRLQLTRLGNFTGKLTFQGKTYPFLGRFTPEGHAEVPVLRRGQTPLQLTLKLDFITDHVEARLKP